MKIFFVIIFTLFFSTFIYSQVDTTNNVENFENLLEDATQDNEDSQLYDSIEYLLNNPIRINISSINELLRIPFLNNITAKAIIHQLNLRGGIYSPDQLKNIEGVNDELIEKILPFLIFGDEDKSSFFESISQQFENTKFDYRARAIQDLHIRKGFSEGKFEGTRPKFYNRFLINSSNNIRAGILFEKDAGEKSFTDFSSYHLLLNDFFIFKKIILGDYIFEFGQGLALWGPYGYGKGSDAVGVVSRNARDAVLSISADENQFFRGAAVKIEFSDFVLTPFFSSHMLDATIDTISNQTTSIVIDGFHRTETEKIKNDKLSEKVFGISADYMINENHKVGILYYQLRYGNEFYKSNLLKPSGSLFEYLSVSYSSTINRLFLTGEIAYNKTSVASIHNAKLFIDKNFSLVFSFRNFPRNYVGQHSNTFGEKGTAQNETGFYTGFYLKTRFGSFNFYFDQFKYPYAGSNYYFPSKGNEFLLYYTYKPFANTEIRIRYKNENKEITEVIQNETALTKRLIENLRGDIFYKVSKNIQLRTRIEIIRLSSIPNSPAENGFLAFQDIKYAPFSRLNFYGRIIFFRTDTYDSRIYEFENDLLGVLSNPGLYGEGMRWYLIAKYNSPFGLNISLKYSELYKPNERFLGSGDSEIESNLDNRFSLQIDLKF